jgi:DnaB-like helicase C terminal domain/CHC2 zinc finger
MTVAIQDVLGRLQKVRKAGAGYLGLCPAHDDREPSLSIRVADDGKILMNCHGGCEFKVLEERLGYQPGELSGVESSRHAGARRLVSTYVYRNADGSTFGRKERYVDDVGGKSFLWSRPDGERWISGTRGEIPLYRLPELIGAPAAELVLVCEGEKDCDRAASLGLIATTTPNGASTKWRDADSNHFAGRRVCVIADDDEPGRRKAENTAAGLRDVAAAVGVITLPNPNRLKGFDLSDFLDSGGMLADLNAAIAGFDQERLPAEVVDGYKLERGVLDLWEHGDEQGIFPGWLKLAKLYRPRLGEMTIVTGAGNAGKSTWLDDFMARTAFSPVGDEQCPRWHWLVYSAEQFPPKRHASKLLQKILDKPFQRGPTERMSQDDVRDGMRLFREHFTLLDPSFPSCNLDRLLDVARQVKAKRPIEGVLIDPYNVIAATSRTKQESEHDFINGMLTKLRTFAQSERLHVVIVAHPTKLRREAADTELPVARPWDISGSGHWYNHADAIISVWRAMKDEQRVASGEVEIHVSKIRFQPECGQLGMAKLYFDRVTTRFLESPRSRVAPWEAPA